VSIYEALDRLVTARRVAGLRPLKPSKAQKELRAIVEAVHPLRLPDDLLAFWSQVDVFSLDPAPWPAPQSLDFVLETWREHQDGTFAHPRLMLPFCYSSHAFTMVELHAAGDRGGTLFNWAYGGGEFDVSFPSVTAWVDLLATMIETGDFEGGSNWSGEWSGLDLGLWDELRNLRLALALPLPTYGATTNFSDVLHAWPEHWRTSSGLDPVADRGHGATTTIAGLLERARHGDARGTVHARIVSSAGKADGLLVTLDDGSATVSVWCPAAVTAYMNTQATLEYDLLVKRSPATQADTGGMIADIQRAALSGDLAGAQSAAMPLYDALFGGSHQAEALAIRPV